MEAMAAKPSHLEPSEHHSSTRHDFPGPKVFGGSSPSSLQVANSPPPARTPSPMHSDISQSASGAVTPLPSPLLGPHSDIEPTATPGTKTNAFFGSSWKSLIPKPATPPQSKHRHPKSTDSGVIIHSSPLKEPSALADIPTLPLDAIGAAAAGDEQINVVHTGSQTANFFNSPSKHIPSPPPSIRHFSPDERPDSTGALRLHLARLSPARVQPTVGTEESEMGGSHSRSSSHSSGHGISKPRDFVYWTPESSDLSRSSSRSSVSGIRRDFAFTSVNPSSSYSPSNYTSSSPLSRLRQLDETPIPSSPLELLTPKPSDVIPNTSRGPVVSHAHPLVRRETQRNPGECQLQTGATIGDEAPLVLVRLLGKGAFSSVWLARDVEDRLIPPGPRQRRRKSVSTARKQGDMVPGLRPAAQAVTRLGVLNELDGEGAILPAAAAELSHRPLEAPSKVGKLVAVKMLDRTLCDVSDRTRISFVREVEVLRHISHPSVVAFLHAFTISAYHCVVLEYIGGGELFELINSDENHARVTTPLLRRMWGELCRAVGWLHGVAIVHRDIKLENILLTINPFLQDEPIELDSLPQPLVKLTDFGLARFIDQNQPMLSTRCGSECYAAPELIMGSLYDGRQTDAWACGVVLYALTARSLPFDANPPETGPGSRRRYLVRIAKSEYTWPEDARLATEDLKAVVGKLLTRDPSKRARIVDLWDEEFMRGVGAPSPPWRVAARRAEEAVNEARREEEAVQDDEEEEGVLVDPHDISSVASQELQ